MIWVYGYTAFGLLLGFWVCWARWSAVVQLSVDQYGRPPSRGTVTASAIGALIVYAIAWLPMLIVGFGRLAAEKRRGRR